MSLNEIIKIGEIFEIKNNDFCVRTKLQDVLDEKQFVVLQPTVKGIPLRADEDELLQFSFYRPSGVYTFYARMKETFIQEGIVLCKFIMVSKVKKTQRREAYRLPIVLDVVVTAGDKDQEKQYKGKTVNLSEKSVLISCFSVFPVGTKVTVTILLTDFERLTLHARVLRRDEPIKKSEPYGIVLLFEDCTNKERSYISRYILKEQIIARRKRFQKSPKRGDI